jgi:hypothetical protein
MNFNKLLFPDVRKDCSLCPTGSGRLLREHGVQTRGHFPLLGAGGLPTAAALTLAIAGM